MNKNFKKKLWNYYNASEVLAKTPRSQPFLPTNYLRLKRFFNEIKGFDFNKVLDIGCQEGFVLGKIEADEKYGLDVSKEAVSYARQNGIRAKLFDLNNKIAFPYKSDTFDFIICLATLEHIIHPTFVINEIYRVLKPGGFFYLMTDSAEAYTDKLCFSKIKLKKGFNEHLHLFTKKEILNLLSRFEIRKIFSYGYLIHLPFLDKLCIKSRLVRILFYHFNEILSKLPVTKDMGGLYFCLAQKPR